MSDESNHVAETVPMFAGDSALQYLSRSLRLNAVLLVYHRNGVEMARLNPGTSLVVGREPPANIVIQDGNLSRRHASFTMENGEIVVQDLGSKNGVRVAGQRVERSVIRPGDEVLLGALTVSIHMTLGHEIPSFDLESHDTLRTALDFETVRAKFFGQAFAMVTVRALRHAKSHLQHWCPRLRPLLRPVDRVALYSQESIEILLPEIKPEKVEELVRMLVTPQDGEAILVAGVALYPSMATSPDKLIAESRNAARHASADVPVRIANAETSTTWLATTASEDDNLFTATSPAMRSVVQTATRVAKATIPVLLHGETGTGKEVLSRLIHDHGPRRNKPMVCINCAAIPATLIESTLFGHEKGSFTGANQTQKGVFEAADGGTLLLDEVGELAPATQAALLRVLDSKRVTRVGSTKEIDVDVRVLAATHRDLEAMCEAGTFRQDLYFRLSTMTIAIPPLRNRREDIAPLVGRFLKQAAKVNDSHIRGISREAMDLLERYAWPGNIRELRNAIDRAVVIAEGDSVTARDLPDRIRVLKVPPAPNAAALPPRVVENRDSPSSPDVTALPAKEPSAEDTGKGQAESLKERLENTEAQFILEALRAAGWNQTEAAKQLNMPLRTLQYKIKSFGITKAGYKLGESKPGDSS